MSVSNQPGRVIPDFTPYEAALANFPWEQTYEVPEAIKECSLNGVVTHINGSIKATIDKQEPINKEYGKRHTLTELFIVHRQALDAKYANERSTPERINAATDSEKYLAQRTVKQMSIGASPEEVAILRNATLLFGIEKIQLLANPTLNTTTHQITQLENKLAQLNMFMGMISSDPTKAQMISLVQLQINETKAQLEKLTS